MSNKRVRASIATPSYARGQLGLMSSDQRGSVFIELAFAMPLMILLIFGGVELARFLLNSQKIDRVATATADMVTQARSLTEQDINNLFIASRSIMGNDSIERNGTVIISSISRAGNDPAIIHWQRKRGNASASNSEIGVEGGQARLPQTVVMGPGDSVVAVEVLYTHKPFLFDTVVGEQDLYEAAFYRPRFGALDALE